MKSHPNLWPRELLGGTYRPGGYRNFVVHEPTERKISAAPFRDRVVGQYAARPNAGPASFRTGSPVRRLHLSSW